MKKFIFTLGTTALLSASFAGGASAHGAYEVQPGDTLSEIAKKHEVSVNYLKEVNSLSSDLILPKQQLNIDSVKEEVTYKVNKGDTLSSISAKFGVSVDDIMKWNGLSSDLIISGEQLYLSANSSNKAVSTASTQHDGSAKAQSADQGTVTKELTVSATAYTANCKGCIGITKTGVDLINNPNAKVIAVDPNVIPLGSKVHVDGYGYATAADIGGAIKGNKIDVFIPSYDEAIQWGKRTVNVKIIN